MAGVTFTSQVYGGFSLKAAAGKAVEARTAPIASGYTINIGTGDPIQINSSGYINAAAAGTAPAAGDPDGVAIDGVFLGITASGGFKSSDPYDVRLFRKNWVGASVTQGAADTMCAYVPAKENLFIAKPVAGQTITQAYLGDLKSVTQGNPDAYGNSTFRVDLTSTPADATTATVKIVDFVRDQQGGFAALVVELVNAR